MHERLLSRLSNIANVYLVSRLKDERLEMAAEDEMRIFLPDTHLLSHERAELFRYATNHPALLEMLTGELRDFKASEKQQDNNVIAYQMGDFLDIWRQTPSYWTVGGHSNEWEANLQQTLDDNTAIISNLLHEDLQTQFLYGNHDIDLRWLPAFSGWKLRFLFPSSLVKMPCSIALHGDVFSQFEKFTPQWLQYLAVYLFGPVVKPREMELGRLRKRIVSAHNKRKYTNYIRQEIPAATGAFVRTADGAIPEEHNIKRPGTSNKTELQYLKESKDLTSEINSLMEWNLNAAFIGHTHNARIAVEEDGDSLFALVDCGAWIERCRGIVDGQEIVMDNAQIVAATKDDVRIYHLSPE
ncbi:hypothetical protein ACFLR7_03580 [Acidobacteriota bacterium]